MLSSTVSKCRRRSPILFGAKRQTKAPWRARGALHPPCGDGKTARRTFPLRPFILAKKRPWLVEDKWAEQQRYGYLSEGAENPGNSRSGRNHSLLSFWRKAAAISTRLREQPLGELDGKRRGAAAHTWMRASFSSFDIWAHSSSSSRSIA